MCGDKSAQTSNLNSKTFETISTLHTTKMFTTHLQSTLLTLSVQPFSFLHISIQILPSYIIYLTSNTKVHSHHCNRLCIISNIMYSGKFITTIKNISTLLVQSDKWMKICKYGFHSTEY